MVALRRSPASASGCSWLILLVFGAFWSTLTLVFDVMIGVQIAGQIRAVGYPSVRGTVIASTVAVGRGSKGGRTYRPDVAYDYTVDGVAYHGTKYRYDQASTSDRGYADRVVGEFRPGKQVDVFYNPNDPADAVLSTGLEGSDLFLPMFLTPFNAVMLGLWWAAASMIWRRVRQSPAGGVRIRDDGMTLRAGVARQSPVVWGIGVLAAASFVSIFIVAFAFGGFHPSLGLMTAVWAAVIALAVIASLAAIARNATGRYDLVLDLWQGNLTLPAVLGRTEPNDVSVASIEGVTVQEERKTGSKGSVSYEYYPTLAIRRGDGPPVELRIALWRDPAAAEEFAAWLRERLRLAEEQSAHARPKR